MKIVSLRLAPEGDSGAEPIERIVPSAGETIVSSPPEGERRGSRKKESKKSPRRARTAPTIS